MFNWLLGAKFIVLYFIWCVGGDSYKNSQIKKNVLFFFVLTFVTKVTEYLCSVWGFFLETNFDFLNSHFEVIFLNDPKSIVVLSLN